jgi:excisionase family DNA binding protein
MERRFLSPREVAEYVGVHLQTVYAMIARGEIKSARLGRRVLVDKRRLDAQLEAAAIRDGGAT